MATQRLPANKDNDVVDALGNNAAASSSAMATKASIPQSLLEMPSIFTMMDSVSNAAKPRLPMF
eukprot:3926906-Amphidinium_carterae.1